MFWRALCVQNLFVYMFPITFSNTQVMLSNHWRVGKSRTCADYSVVGNIVKIILKLSITCIFKSMCSVSFPTECTLLIMCMYERHSPSRWYSLYQNMSEIRLLYVYIINTQCQFAKAWYWKCQYCLSLAVG
jgi:hypothetical protein